MLASHGGGLVGVPHYRRVPSGRDWAIPAGGWYNLQDPVGPTRFQQAVSQPGAASFSVGMPDYPAIYAIRAWLDYIQRVGVETIHQATKPQVAACLQEVRRLPVEMLTPGRADDLAGIIAFRHPHMDAIQRHLHACNVHVMAQAGRMRVAFFQFGRGSAALQGYNTAADIEAFFFQLGRAQGAPAASRPRAKEALQHVPSA